MLEGAYADSHSLPTVSPSGVAASSIAASSSSLLATPRGVTGVSYSSSRRARALRPWDFAERYLPRSLSGQALLLLVLAVLAPFVWTAVVAAAPRLGYPSLDRLSVPNLTHAAYCYSALYLSNLESQAVRRHKIELLVKYVSELLDEAGVEHWYTAGGLLALERENSLTLEWDDDADFGVMGYHAHKVLALRERIAADGHHIAIGMFGTPERRGPMQPRIAKVFFEPFDSDDTCRPDPDNSCYGHGAPVHVDLFFLNFGWWKNEAAHYTHVPTRRLYTRNTSGYRWVPTMAILPTRTNCSLPALDSIGGGCLRLPADTKELLLTRYGPDWRVPQNWGGPWLKHGKCSYISRAQEEAKIAALLEQMDRQEELFGEPPQKWVNHAHIGTSLRKDGSPLCEPPVIRSEQEGENEAAEEGDGEG